MNATALETAGKAALAEVAKAALVTQLHGTLIWTLNFLGCSDRRWRSLNYQASRRDPIGAQDRLYDRVWQLENHALT